MIKLTCVLVLLAACCLALPVDESPKLPRPSPINPEVQSDPKPTEAKDASAPHVTAETHVQKVPASGVKLSVEVAKNEGATSTELPGKNNPKRSVEPETVKPPAFRRNQPSTTTEQPSSTTASSTTSSPVSVKTPVGTTRGKREVDITAATTSATASKRTTTVAPATASDDKEGPHFVRPVPVDQILKNLGQPEKADHEKPEPKPKDDKPSEEDSDEDSPKKEEHEPSAHLKTHPVIRQQGA